MTRASITILDLGGGDDGHRAKYFASWDSCSRSAAFA